MHLALAKWLDSPSGREDKTVLGLLAELIAVNYGQFDVTGIGTVTPNESVWGRVGLTPPEAIDLIKLTSFMCGMFSILGDGDALEIKEMIQREIDRCERKSALYIPTHVEIGTFGNGKLK